MSGFCVAHFCEVHTNPIELGLFVKDWWDAWRVTCPAAPTHVVHKFCFGQMERRRQVLATAKFTDDADNIRYDERSKAVVVGYAGAMGIRLEPRLPMARRGPW